MSRIKYRLPYTIRYYSRRYDKWMTVPNGYPSDGASGPALDVWSEAWWVHDRACPNDEGEAIPAECVGFWERNGFWDDGSACGPRESSHILADILRAEGRWARALAWYWAVLPAQLWVQRGRDLTKRIDPLVAT